MYEIAIKSKFSPKPYADEWYFPYVLNVKNKL